MTVEKLFDPSGLERWRSGSELLDLPPDQDRGQGRRRGLAEVLGNPAPHLCKAGDVLRQIERLEFIERRGSLPGFLTVLPRGEAFECAAEALNDDHAAALGAVRMQFPLVFDGSMPDMRELTRNYVHQGRVFTLGNGDEKMSLAYASDPGLFAWLRGHVIDPARLPYVIYSPAPAFRRWKSGELGLRALRQYTLPDLHVLCLREQAREMFMTLITAAAAVARQLFGEAFVQFTEINEQLATRHPGLTRDVAVAGAQFTVERTLSSQEKYFALKAGINIDIGSGSIMLFNFQWDEVNSARFSFHAGGEPVTVLHATLSGALAKVLPAIVGRGLSGLGPRTLPVALAPVQVLVLPLAERHRRPAALAAQRLLEAGIRAAVGSHSGPLASRVNALRAAWNPFHAVVGDREATGQSLRLHSPTGPEVILAEQFLAEDGRIPRPAQERARESRLDGPFA